jgi:carboxyl-terminal processing protease
MPFQPRSHRLVGHAGIQGGNGIDGGQRHGALSLLAALTLALTLAFAGCGGGSGGDAGSGGTVATPLASQAGGVDTIVASASVENVCVAPRTGIDPDTRQPFTDKPGTLTQEKSWVRAYIDETYLWFDEIPASVRAANYATPQTYFDALRTPVLTASGRPKDRFHFRYDTPTWRALSQSGAMAGYGFELVVVKSTPPRDVRVAYTEPNTPATAAGIARGARVLSVDGADAVNGASVDALNAGVSPARANETHSFTFQDFNGNIRAVNLTSQIIVSTPVQNVKVIATPTGSVGYLLFNDHLATSESQLIDAITQLKAAGVTDLVIDVRYNGGGYLGIASELAYMVATPAATTGTVFERLLFNRKNPFGLTPVEAATPFHAVSRGYSTTPGQALPQLGLSRVTLLTGPGTCSASESIANGLRGVNVQVALVGEATCGKPYGFLPQDNCGTTYFAIQFNGVNNKGFGDYSDGLAPTCQVADDFGRALGDPLEGRLAAALSYRATGICPPASSTFAKATVVQSGKSSDPTDSFSVIKPLSRAAKILQLERR